MSAIVTVLRQQNQLLQSQVEQLAEQVEALKTNLASALSKLQPHDPDFVQQFLVQPSAIPVPATDIPEEIPGPATPAPLN